MRIGIPREIKVREGRVGLIPGACAELVRRGHEVFIEKGAGENSGYPDDLYRAVGAGIVPDAEALYGAAQLIVKVKEPVEGDLRWLRAEHLLFSFLHLAPLPELTQKLLDIGLTAVAFETVAEGGRRPVLAPMSAIAGRLAVHFGAYYLHQSHGGKGVLLGGLAGADRGRVVVLGAGTAGGHAASLAAALGARVTAFDKNPEVLERLHALGGSVTALYPYPDLLEEAVGKCDLLIGAVLVPGAKAPRLIGARTVRAMQPGSVVVDISVDQGGCVETIRPTNHERPTYLWEGIVHFGVTNMPGVVPRTASQSLSSALIPYVLRLAAKDWEEDPALRSGLSVKGGKIIHPALQGTLS